MDKDFLELLDYTLNNNQINKLLDDNTISKLISDIYHKIFIDQPKFDNNKPKITLYTFMFNKEEYIDYLIHNIQKMSIENILILNIEYVNNLITKISNMDEITVDRTLKHILIMDKREEQLNKLL